MSDFWQETIDYATAIRRDLHKVPELGWKEVQTAQTIRSSLTKLEIPWRECADTGTVAYLNQSESSKHTIALRGDIDALPITEKTEKPYCSQIDGCMHACGHDGHTATLLAAAKWLKCHEDSLSKSVVLLFQPAEEGGHGAAKMIDDGALDGVDEIFGWHNWPAIPFGEMYCPDGIVMCGNGTFNITVTGKGGHASQPELCRDPVLAASAINLNLQQIVSRRLPPQKTAVLSVTAIEAPSGLTVIPEKAVLGGSIRVPDRATRDIVNHAIIDICNATSASYGVTCDVEIQDRYEATINHQAQAQNMREQWKSNFGDEALSTEVLGPIMASEDFSYYLSKIPGAFALIGADDGKGHDAPCHSAYYDFNDRLIPRVTQLFSSLVGVSVSGNLK